MPLPAGGGAALGLVVSATCGALFCESVLLRGRAAGLLVFGGGVAVAVCSVSAGAFACCELPDENRLEKKPECVGALGALAEVALVDPVEVVSVEATRVLFLLNRPPKKLETVPPLVLDGLLAAYDDSLVEICGGSRPGCNGGTCKWPSLSYE